MNIVSGGYKFGPVVDVCVSEDQGLMCIEENVPSPSQVVSPAWIRTNRGVTQWERQSSKIAPDFEGEECIVVNKE